MLRAARPSSARASTGAVVMTPSLRWRVRWLGRCGGVRARRGCRTPDRDVWPMQRVRGIGRSHRQTPDEPARSRLDQLDDVDRVLGPGCAGYPQAAVLLKLPDGY